MFEQLIRDLRDRSLPSDYRSLVALVLGTLGDPRADGELAAELARSSVAQWTIVLIHALGAEKESNEDDEIFDLPDSPFVQEIAGLRLTIKTNLTERGIRDSVLGFLDHSELEIRRAAARALAHSTDHEDLRQRFLGSMSREEDEDLRAGYGHAIAAWVAKAPVDSPERGEVVRAVLDSALRPENAALRFRIEGPLATVPFTSEDLERVSEAALQPPMERQLWSLTLLSKQASTHPAAVENICHRLLSPASAEKVREYAARALGAIRSDSSERSLVALLTDPSWGVRLSAIQGLAGRPGAAIPLSQAASADADERVRKAAEEALKR